MLEDLKERVCAANLALVRHGLVVLTWGNASAIDRDKGLVVIKPSGVSYDALKPDDMVQITKEAADMILTDDNKAYVTKGSEKSFSVAKGHDYAVKVVE